jgi:hypothetical protein
VLLKRPDGCKLDRTFSTQGRVWAEMHVVWTDDAWSNWRPDFVQTQNEAKILTNSPFGHSGTKIT